ncbi:hypothetical protein Msil_2763 [Methylocella silvestris BL2]|uniref:Uncharacterized protein n=2 Tax=Methylocella silvestris TaxID=199596 RepID=B8ERY5_METSB|nr:hypothetical protein Msil_2763 [Methylocella silvestris BL2]
MVRAKPTEWSPVGIEGANLDDICSDAFFHKIIADHLGTFDEDTSSEIAKRIRRILGELRIGLHYRKRPTEGSKSAALRACEMRLNEAVESIAQLDDDSRQLVIDASYSDDKGDDPFRNKYEAAFRQVKALARWVQSAGASVEKRSPPGRTFESDEAQAVGKLLKLWQDTKGRSRSVEKRVTPKDPTVEELTCFARDTLAPVFCVSSRKPNLAGHINRALYGNNQPIKK